jgi:hypothetical protein|tara:strand:+ start:2668 stop:3318 length:651 start_codon:yes stop_codon:yes gene_type:complete
MPTKNLPNIGARTINSFRSKLIGGGARPNLFEVVLQFPDGVGIDANAPEDSRFMVKAANLPASNINVIDVPFRGRNLKIAGDRTFDVWTITVINDTTFNLRNAFELWMNGINKHDNATGETTPADYQTDAMVYQLGRSTVNSAQGNDGSIQGQNDKLPVLKSYKFHGIFPTNLSAIELSYDQPDTIEEFTVDLQVQWWDAFKGGQDSSMLGSDPNA